MVEQNNKYNGEEKSGDFLQDGPNELKLAYMGIALGAPTQYQKDVTTGLKSMSLLIPNGKDNGFTPCVFTFGLNDCIGNSAYNAICKNIGVHDLIFTNNSISAKNKALADLSSLKVNVKKGTPYPEWVAGRYEKFLKEVEEYCPLYHSSCSEAVNDYVENLKKMYTIDSKSKNHNMESQQSK